MDVGGLAAQALPYLTTAATEAAKAAGGMVTKALPGLPGALWQRLWPRLENDPAAKQAIAEVAANPADQDAADTLRVRLKKLLAADPELAREVAALFGGSTETRTVTASGERAVAIGGDAVGNTIVTGTTDSRTFVRQLLTMPQDDGGFGKSAKRGRKPAS